ncbi:hypothetical protein [Thiocapsa sp.]|uniref:hypothetical protein n=1 Tax=Thiocapsa sp. TaxID=2024551 RepID=UPI001BCF9E20|nr:hypothetical protein [Thiocapsa sp.]
MGQFTEDMGRLRDEIASDRTNRHTLIAETREEISASALAFMTDLKDSVETLQSRFRADFAEMAQSNRADRNAFMTHLGTDVANLRVEAAAQREAGRRAFIESAAEARAERASQNAAMREDVAQLQDGFRRTRGEMATEVRAAGEAFVSDIVDAVTGLRRDTIQLVDDLSRERASAREAWRGGMPKAPPPPAPWSVRRRRPSRWPRRRSSRATPSSRWPSRRTSRPSRSRKRLGPGTRDPRRTDPARPGEPL